MTELTVKPLIDTALDEQEKIVALREQTEANFLELGKLLDDFIARELFKPMGHHTVNEWLDSRMLGIGRRTGWKLVGIWRTFGESVQAPALASAGMERLAIVAPKVDAEVIDVEQAMELATEYSTRELTQRFKTVKVPEEKVACPTCGHKVKTSEVMW